MVLPLILAGTAISAIVGAAKALGASEKKEYARNIVSEAESRHKAALERIEQKRKIVQGCLSDLGSQKISIETNQLLLFSKVYSEIKVLSLKHVSTNQEIIPIARQELLKIQLEGEQLEELVASGVTALAAGAATAAGATSLVGAFGAVATTGTAISTLSGAAASNATLAWLGGGSLAAGGAGVAGGMMALGGLVAAPAFLIMGFSAAANAEKMLGDAVAYREKVDGYIKQLEQGIEYLGKVQERVENISQAASSVAEAIMPIINAAQAMIDRRKSDFMRLSWADRNVRRINPLSVKQFTPSDKSLVESLNHHGMLLYALVKIPVFIDGDKINVEQEEVLALTPPLLNRQQEYPVYTPQEFLKLKSVIEAFWRRNRKPGTHWVVRIVGVLLLLLMLLMVIGFLSEDDKPHPGVEADPNKGTTEQVPMSSSDVQGQPVVQANEAAGDGTQSAQGQPAEGGQTPSADNTSSSTVIGVWKGEFYFGQGQLKIISSEDKYLATLDIIGKNGCEGHIENIVGHGDGGGQFVFSRVVNAQENEECTIVVDTRSGDASVQDSGCGSYHGPDCPFAGSLAKAPVQ